MKERERSPRARLAISLPSGPKKTPGRAYDRPMGSFLIGAGSRAARFAAPVSHRTHNKDSLAAQKTPSFNDFSHFPNAPWRAI